MKPVRSTSTWRRGAMVLVLLAFAASVITGCSRDEVAPTQPLLMMSTTDATVLPNLAPEFCPNLPDYPVVVIHGRPNVGTLFAVWFWGIGAGFDLATGDTVPGWCVEDYPQPNVNDPGRVTLYCSYDDALPGNLSDMPINELNYLLNNRYGTWQEIQSAIWLVLGYSAPSIAPTANSHAMAEAALANGGDFVPGPGDLIAIFLYTGDGGVSPDGDFQETIIEMRLPGREGDACTPGYWRTHFDRWPDGFDPMDDFDTTFGTDYFDPDITLGDAIWLGGGHLDELARHGTAALLSAAHGDVGYPYTMGEVTEMVQNGENQTLADTNDDLDCPLGGSPANPKLRNRK